MGFRRRGGVKYRAKVEATASQGEWLLAIVDPSPWMVNEDDGHDGYGRLGRCPAPNSIDPALMMWVHIGEATDLEASWRFAEARSAMAGDRRAWVRVLNETHPDTGWCVLDGITVWDRKE